MIKLQDISDQLNQRDASKEELGRIKSRLVDFHGEGWSLNAELKIHMLKLLHIPRLTGELVLTLHWSLINYSAIVKILKKHDKRTGVLLRAPYLANVLQQV